MLQIGSLALMSALQFNGNNQKWEERTIKQPDRKTTHPDGRVVYEKDFGRRVGTKGEEKLRVVVDPVKNKIIT